ncbi:DUF4179 domain-containing protein [Fictibacillus aquaticus]|uniref:DUF4179 domain-containing protein n=1 Tax=Fictibacillus aquaticus TaxID=2021314 RepID=A0A235F654_9BACL|nr:DUF4179 domain-containing protein [Fictibacillus aquaticus]OYD56593.1 hypothetical protein CGZ90_16405 [Fictibacillus aquaticus]
MFKNQELQLNDYKKSYENIPVSLDSLDAAIMAGFQKAKKEERKKKRSYKWVYSFVAAAVILLGFFATIRVSPAFANAIANLPGMEKIVEMVKFDKGKMSAVENDYYQKIGTSAEKNGMRVTIDGVIADESGMVVFYTLTPEQKKEYFDIQAAKIISLEGKHLDPGTTGFGSPSNEEGMDRYTGELEFYFENKIQGKKFQLDLSLEGEEFSIPFTLTKDIKVSQKYTINKTIEIEGQKLTVVSAEVSPLRTGVHVKMDPNNTKQILALEDLRIVDEKGETWGGINGGVTGSIISADEQIIYLQSNYFHKPEELYVVINKLQAVEKEDMTLVVDTEKLQILKQPPGNVLSSLKIEDNNLVFTMNVKKFHGDPFGEIKDVYGNVIETHGGFFRTSDEEGIKEFGIEMPDMKTVKGPITIELSAYPAWINGEAKVRIK